MEREGNGVVRSSSAPHHHHTKREEEREQQQQQQQQRQSPLSPLASHGPGPPTSHRPARACGREARLQGQRASFPIASPPLPGMDLLAGYGSGSDGEGDDSPLEAPSVRPSAINAAPAVHTSSGAAAAAKGDQRAPARPASGLFARLPAPGGAAPANGAPELPGAPAASLPPGFFDDDAAAPAPPAAAAPSGVPAGFFDAPGAATAAREPEAGPEAGPAAMPPPRAATDDLPGPSDSALWSKLPAPRSGGGGGGGTGGKRKVTFRPQVNLELLAGSDSDDDPAVPAKKARPAAGAGAGDKPSVLSFLPAPKNQPAAPKQSGARMQSGLGGSSAGDTAAGGSGGAAQQRRQQQQQQQQSKAAAAPGPAALGNEAYRLVRPAGAPAAAAGARVEQQQQQYYYQQYDAAAYAQYAPHVHEAAAPAERAAPRPAAAPQPALPPEEALLREALQAEAAKAARRGAGAGTSQLVVPDIQFKEVKADEVKWVDPAKREATQGARAALGSDYAAKLRSEAAPHTGSKLARSKHQIGTLFANAKLRELEVLENRAAGMKSKAETAGKYGWR